MNLDDLCNSISEKELRTNITHWVTEWKQNDKSVHDLSDMIDKWHGNVWFKDENASNDFLNNFQEFKRFAIDNIGGLTVNERLYLFGLFDAWDNQGEITKQRLRLKLVINT